MRVHWPKFWCSCTIHLAANRFDLLNNKSRFFSENSAERCQQQNPLLSSLAAILELSPGTSAERSRKGSVSSGTQSLPKKLLDDISSCACRGVLRRGTNAAECPHASRSSSGCAQMLGGPQAASATLPPKAHEVKEQQNAAAAASGMLIPPLPVPASPVLRGGNNEEVTRAAEVCPRKDLGWALF